MSGASGIKILCYGEVLWDMLPSGPVLGGAPFNLAFRLHGQGQSVRMVSRLGRDELGDRALQLIRDFGLDSSLIQRDSRFGTGAVNVELNSGGDPIFTILPDTAYDRIEFTPELERAAGAAGCVCFGSLAQRTPNGRATLLRLIESAPGALKFLDLNLRPACYSPELALACLKMAGILKLNGAEALEVAGMLGWSGLDLPAFCARCAAEYGLKACVVTLGDGGALAASGVDGEVVYSPGYRVEVADTVGSGDAFSAGFLAAWLSGANLAECCRQGNILGALNSARSGATAPIEESEIRALSFAGEDRQIVMEEHRAFLGQ